MTAGRLPLAHIRVLDLTRARAGPTAARQLADWGADVIKIEAPPGAAGDVVDGSRDGFDFQNLHRNKRSMTLNLKEADGRAIFLKMCETADVIVENYRPDVKFRLGIGPEDVAKVNPRLVYGSNSGFGQSGPYRDRPGVDQIAQGMGGLMSVTGLPGQGPVRVGIPIADLTAGLMLAQGIILALYDRERTGKGQWVHTSLLEAQIFMMDFQAARFLKDNEVPGQAGNDHPTSVPTGVFPTSDGHINIAASGGTMFPRLAKALGRPELLDDPDFKTGKLRSDNRARLNGLIADVTKTKPSQYWVELLNEVGVPCGPIYDMGQTLGDPQVKHLGIARPMDSPRLGTIEVVGQAFTLTGTPQPERMRKATPELGEDTDAILADLGYSGEQIADFRARKVI